MIGRSDSSPALAAQGDATVGARRDWPSVDRCVAESDQLALRPRLGHTSLAACLRDTVGESGFAPTLTKGGWSR
jgi:hypothetical protein